MRHIHCGEPIESLNFTSVFPGKGALREVKDYIHLRRVEARAVWERGHGRLPKARDPGGPRRMIINKDGGKCKT
jgi:hypothetical protein